MKAFAKGLFACVAVVSSLVLPSQALAQCAPHEEVVSLLSERYQENQKAMGVVGDSRIIELFVSADGSWTLVMTQPTGRACIIAAGQNWEEMPLQVAGRAT